MRDNPKFQPSTIHAYRKAVQELVYTYGENPTIEHLNRFIADKCTKRQPHVKYAIKEYLRFKERGQDYGKLNQAVIKIPMKQKNFLKREYINELLGLVKDPMHKAFVVIQSYAGARASEAITIEKRWIKRGMHKDRYGDEGEIIKIRVKGKGEKPRNLYLKMDLWKYLEPFYKRCYRYLFLNERTITYMTYWNSVETVYARYYRELNDAGTKLGLDIGTHDLRRSFANTMRLERKDITIVQRTLGHSNIRTTMRYFDDNNKEIEDAMLEYQDNI